MELLKILPVVFLIFLIFFFLIKPRKRKTREQPPIDVERKLLENYVSFYAKLNNQEQQEFLKRLRIFLSKIKIIGVKTKIEDLDKVYIASAAIIPIFNFKNWEYLNQVLVYPHSFSSDFELKGEGRNTIGMVGNGPMENTMILSLPDLRSGFSNQNSTSNTAIHEFVHLLDKSDGKTDGLPVIFIEHQYAVPWLDYIHKNMLAIQNGKSDINPYALTNRAEFFAVVSEYFFKQPELMSQKHPELFKILEIIFKTSTQRKDSQK